MSKLRWTQRARRDLVAIARYLAADDPPAAQRWVAQMRKRARAAARLPRSGRRVPELTEGDLREVVVKNYRLIYRADSDGITVLTVFETHHRFPRDLPD
jgi:plasmid stabilization system protein ParE